MSWLIPLGFIGFSGLAVLLLIYLIKPNFQNKFVSSTFVWKLSLKQKRRKNPISKIKNLLILICQILIIVFCTFIIARPAIVEISETFNEEIIIIDASASMMAKGDDDTTRFERAVMEARAIASKTFDNDGAVSVIFADNNPAVIVSSARSTERASIDSSLAALIDGESACTYGSADIDKAMLLAGEIAGGRSTVHTVLLTGKKYDNAGRVEVRDMSLNDGSEWNVAVLDVRTELNKNNAYVINVDLACYGRDLDVNFTLSLANANGASDPRTYTLDHMPGDRLSNIRLSGNRITTVSIDTELIPDDKATVAADGSQQATPVFSFASATALVQVNDSISVDNQFTLYGNNKQALNIQYASMAPNSFFASAFTSLVSVLRTRWAVNVREVRAGLEEPQYSGYDLYVFENYNLERAPTDGVVFVVNPEAVPADLGFNITPLVSTPSGVTLELGQQHAITNNINVDNLVVTRFNPLMFYSSEKNFETLLSYNNLPVLACKNTNDSKVIAMSFSLNYSMVAISVDFPRLILNAINYFIPSTFTKNVYEINDTVTFTPRGTEFKVSGGGEDKEYTDFPATFTVKRVGAYTVTQTPISGKTVTERFFVRIPTAESNIVRTIEVLGNQFYPVEVPPSLNDLCVYFAAALILLVVVERFLYARTVG